MIRGSGIESTLLRVYINYSDSDDHCKWAYKLDRAQQLDYWEGCITIVRAGLVLTTFTLVISLEKKLNGCILPQKVLHF